MDSRSERHHPLDLLRGLAAIGIASYHFMYVFHDVEVQSLGTFGVYLFFVLSSLTMMLVYAQTFSRSITVRDAKLFYWNRISRIMPLLCAVAFVNFAFVAWDGPRFTTLVSFAMRAFLTGSGLFSLHLPGYLSNSMGAWSLGIEIFFYVVFPLICLIANSVSVRALVVTAITAILSQQTIMLLLQRWATEDPLRFWHYYTTPLTFALFFTLGILIYRSNGLRTRRNLIWSLCAGAAIMSFSLFVNVNIFISNTSYLGLTAIAFCAVFFAYRSELPGFLIAPATFLGNISYALYLTHPFSLIIARTIASSLQLGPAFRDIMYLMIAVTLAWCSFVLFERPARNFLRDLYAPTSMEPTAQRLAPPI